MTDVRVQALDLLQSGFPLETDPYGVAARQLGATRSEVLEAVAALRAEGTIRRLGASFSSKELGYSSTLCALAVPGTQEDVDRAAQVVDAIPNVTHNYLRTNRYNLWFTIIARGPEEVARILDGITRQTGCTDALNLPATALYKIRVDFSEMGKGTRKRKHHQAPEDGGQHAPAFDAADAFDVALVRWAQDDIAGEGAAVDPEPYATAAARIAADLGNPDLDEQAVIARLSQLKANGTIRRFGALVAHRKMGYAFNGMTVWNVPDDQADAVGRVFAEFPFVSHCYARPRTATWPYNLYAMVHAQTQEDLDARVAELEAAAGCTAQVLVSTKEYKKTSMRYFE